MLKRFILFSLFFTYANAATLSETDKQIAVQYLTSSTYPDIVNACSATFPENADKYKTALHKWFEANNLVLSKGKLIFEAQAKAENPEKNPDDIIKQFNQLVSLEFSQLSDTQKVKRCSLVFEDLKNEQ